MVGEGGYYTCLFHPELNLLVYFEVLTSCLSVSLINRSWKTLRHSFLQTLTIWVTVWNLHDGRGKISLEVI